MITVTTIPVSTATTQNVALQIVEPLCLPVPADATIGPMSQLTFKAGAVKVVGDNAIVPITVSGIVAFQSKACCKAVPKMFSETFSVGFDATATNTITLTPSDGVVTELSGIQGCNKAHSYTVFTSLAITIA